MKKISDGFILKQYQSGIKSYSDFTQEVGLWASEEYVFDKYLGEKDRILDLGCGTGRTTFPLFNLGYTNIIGIDLTPEMINEAQILNDYFGLNISFEVGDAKKLPFADDGFNVVIFSFNGMMSIPSKNARDRALSEISRVLKEKGYFIFTTHDRLKDPTFFPFWEEEKIKWKEGKQNPRLYEFGDIVTNSKNESREIFIHIPDMEEIENWTSDHGFRIIETFYRSDIFDESPSVKEKSGECRFWVVEKR